MSDLIGQMLGQYQIVEQIGMGGMATVYKAYQASMDRYVAIKVLPQQLAEDPEFIGRFEQEARTIAKLENQHILPVYDYGEYNGYTYLVMRYIGTGTLKKVVEQGALPLAAAVNFLTQIADALQYAHDHGVVHRDVKTSNVLIGEGQVCYLTDFGIAKLAAGSAHFTGTGSVIGTPAYMSPEQCNGLPVDARSDIYSLGIVLYEMLTGALPFEAETPVAVVLKQINEPLPPPRALNPGIPEAVEKVVFRALAKDPDDRYQSAKDFAGALREAFESFTERQTASFPIPAAQPVIEAPTRESAATTPVSAARPTRPRWQLWAGLAALAAAVVIIAIIALSGGGGKPKTGGATAIGAAGEVATLTAAARPTEALTPTRVEPTATAGEVAAPTVAPPPETGWTVFTSTRALRPTDRHLLIDDQGIWMNSQGGLVRWQRDGTYTKYTTANGLIFNTIQAMACDQAGYLWLGGGEGQYGVMRLELDANHQITHIDYFDSSNSNVDSDYFWAFLPASDGTMLVGTYQYYLEKWDGQQWTASDVPTEGLDVIGDRAWALLRTTDGTLWVSGPDGLARLQNGAWQAVDPPVDVQGDEYEGYEFTWLYQDPLDGSIWVNFLTRPDWTPHTGRLVLASDGTWTWDTVGQDIPSPLNDMLRASDNSLWLLGEDTVVRLDSATGRRTVFDAGQGIRGEYYYDLAQDADGTMWLTTDTALAYYDGQRWISFVTENEPADADINAMAEAPDGTLWFVAHYGTLLRYQENTWETVESFDVDTFDLALQGDVIWIASAQGLYRWQAGRSRHYDSTNSSLTRDVVLRLALDPNHPDWLWIGTIDGLYLMNTADDTMRAWTREQNNFPGPAISALHFDQTGTLWVGTAFDDGEIGPGEATLVRIANPPDPDNLSWTVEAALNDPFYDADRDVLAIAEDDQGNQWIGTGESLYRRAAGGHWQKMIESDGAPEFARVNDIVPVGDVVWVAVYYEGLYRYDRAGWFNLGRMGSGTGDVNRLYRTSDGALWVLSDDGIARLVGDPFAID
jgi:ligand-binding sensor domain-containing protein